MGDVHKGRRVDFYPDDWLAGTLELTIEEEGAYARVCFLIYSKGGPLPDNDRWLAGMCRVSTRRWRALRHALADKGKIEIRDGRIYQARCERELEKARIRARKLAEIGSNGGRKSAEARAKSLKRNGTDQAKAQVRARATLHHHQDSSVSNDTGSQELPLESPPESKAEGAPIINIGGVIFGSCLAYLVANDVAKERARSLLAQWRKNHGPGLVIEVVSEAQRHAVSEPVAWIIAALAKRSARPQGPPAHAMPRRRDAEVI